MEKLDLSVIILTFNEEIHIRRCLENAFRVTKDVFVIDSFSTDRTVEIAKDCGAIVFQHEYKNQAQQFQWALDNCPIKTGWTLRMDADEYLTDELIQEMETTLPTLSEDVTGCNLPLRVVFMGKMLKHGLHHQVQILRLWRTGCVYMEQRWMDERCVLTRGTAINLKNSFVDHNLKGLGEFTIKHNGYSNREAFMEINRRYNLIDDKESEELSSRNRQKTSYYRLPRFFRAFIYFSVRYFLFFGFLDGLRGFVWLTLQAYWYRFLVDAKLYEMEKRLGKEPTKEQVADYVRQYWGIKIN
jgi:glycosyltransferase involved in cell wall biosynthesis